jgi:hypothetical protein
MHGDIRGNTLSVDAWTANSPDKKMACKEKCKPRGGITRRKIFNYEHNDTLILIEVNT